MCNDAWGRLMSEWISVKERLPNRETTYVTISSFKIIAMRKFHINRKCRCRSTGCIMNFSEFFTNCMTHKGITHWMLLPEPPNE